MWYAFDLIDDGLITPETFVSALRHQMRARLPLGQLAVQRGMMTMSQVMEILESQAGCSQPFGKIAADKGYLSESQLSELIFAQLMSMPSLEDVLVENGWVPKEDLDAAMVRLRSRLGVFREQQFEALSEELQEKNP